MNTFPLSQAQIKSLLIAKAEIAKQEVVIEKWSKAASETFYVKLQEVKQ